LPWKILIPLSSKGLWEAEIMMAASAFMSWVRKATAGVGSTPTVRASTPMEQIPATRASSIMGPESLVSRPMRMRCLRAALR